MSDSVIFDGFGKVVDTDLEEVVLAFCESFDPLERQKLIVLVDDLTGATFTECHVAASTIASLGTTDVPLDPDASPDYRANRELVEDHSAFAQMKEDAAQGRKFSNIVCEYAPKKTHSLEVIGGQHRFQALADSAEKHGDVRHGLKVYFNLTREQRLDVQVISNTNITVSSDLLDRMYATMEGTELDTRKNPRGLDGVVIH